MPEKPGRKEPETAQTFDPEEYKSNLIDNQGYSEETAKVLCEKKKEQLEAAVGKPAPVAKIEIDLSKL